MKTLTYVIRIRFHFLPRLSPNLLMIFTALDLRLLLGDLVGEGSKVAPSLLLKWVGNNTHDIT